MPNVPDYPGPRQSQSYARGMELSFDGPIVEWRGPAPYYYVAVPADECDEIAAVAQAVTYGWGCIPVSATIGETEFTTALFPKDGGYLLPLKVVVRRAEGIDEGDTVGVRMRIEGP